MVRVLAALLAAVTVLPVQDPGCIGLIPPVPGPIVASFAPIGQYAGHWGIDLAAEPGDPVTAAGYGTVTFAGAIDGRQSVTIDHGGGLKTSYSYVASMTRGRGDVVSPGEEIATAGTDHGADVVHFSVRLDGVYVDPVPWLACHRVLSPGLRLVPAPH